jgi:hypothetical protein
MNLYDWPPFSVHTDLDKAFVYWAKLVQEEVKVPAAKMAEPLPDDPVELDKFVTTYIEGWGPRVAALAVTAEWFLQQAKSEKWPEKLRSADGKPLNTDADRTAEYEGLLKDYRWVRNYLDMLVTHMRDRMRWSQSVRKQHQDIQSGNSGF